ncbi:MAG: hypothetical protein A2951_02195 [Candidatus Buchananbacteria bacterium RIFCSPLOWO2_01_FULL_56_15]|uniref:Uncharacterized protein n=2 Tax=Candidatus Buchananiibacteriota TaxID=1817903 RepID=A0A1G1YES6_9BACT|nr:MAG: hypothetical protein A3J59_00070 [Candidatus Buchananbacteria bacterium RIFCSPHIGHO2_02_FULL_56_16]OGY54778.1 MAG: hypothetical protein A2951_02195 [Candidatus Buchananbacteria bacterium RIFCSPLOWO2_01_FULL_56_15]
MENKIEIVKSITRETLREIAKNQFGDMVKAVVDVGRTLMAIGGELHADEEALLLEDGSRQADLWGINVYPAKPSDDWIVFDSVINVRPSQGNRSRGIEDTAVRARIMEVVGNIVQR